MGRYYWDTKTTVEGLKKIDMVKLKQMGFLIGSKSGNLQWTNGSGEKMGDIDVVVSTIPGDAYIQLSYVQTHRDTGVKNDFNYKHRIVETPCNYGGVRYWFICALTTNGRYCGRRVRVLYKAGDYFGCRHCYNLTYESRNLNSFERPFGKTVSAPELDEMLNKIKKTHYRGKITKRYKRYVEAERRLTAAMMAVANVLSR